MTGRYIVQDHGWYAHSRTLGPNDELVMEFVRRPTVAYVSSGEVQVTPDIQQAQVFSDFGTPIQDRTKAKFLGRPEEYTVIPVMIVSEDLLVLMAQMGRS